MLIIQMQQRNKCSDLVSAIMLTDKMRKSQSFISSDENILNLGVYFLNLIADINLPLGNRNIHLHLLLPGCNNFLNSPILRLNSLSQSSYQLLQSNLLVSWQGSALNQLWNFLVQFNSLLSIPLFFFSPKKNII